MLIHIIYYLLEISWLHRLSIVFISLVSYFNHPYWQNEGIKCIKRIILYFTIIIISSLPKLSKVSIKFVYPQFLLLVNIFIHTRMLIFTFFLSTFVKSK